MVSRRNLFTAAAIVPVAAAITGCGKTRGNPPQQSERAAGKREFLPAVSGREMMHRRYFPNVKLISSTGQQYKFYDDLLKDKIVVLNFMYADCEGICPTILSNLKRVRRVLDQNVTKDIYIYSITLRPEVDTPEKLKAYAAMHRVDDPRWLFLTGKSEDVDALRHLLGFADPDPELDKDRTRHSGMIRYGNEAMSLWGGCQGSGEPQWLAQEIQFAVPREFLRHPRVND